MGFSTVGKKKVASHAVLLVLDLVVLGLAVKVNKFNEFFYVADLFPLALSIVTLVFLFFMISIDFALDHSWTGFPQTEIGVLGILSILWLSFNAFSTSRWKDMPMNCGSIPLDFPAERTWCRDVQALKAFVWITFAVCAGIVLCTARYCITQRQRGNKHIFSMPLSRYRSRLNPTSHYTTYSAGRGSEFLQQFEKI
ncbi:hypothetical protein D9611_011438 [Ephemerocybe angulata]|uniref:MARVEL domain-containing protein n=1 Tax=Ephemerocybe angulata TaxID=980116 RepID=A0A8H5FJK7_9AGAR|nr:hypothetical protein D9611_011438 [Tulosesus angulatus]